MKIGQFSDSFLPIVDGVGRVAYYYCNTLSKKGHEVSAIAPLKKIGYRAQYPFEIIDYYSKELPQTAYSIGIPFLDEHFEAHLGMTEFDICHVHTPFIAGLEGIKYAKSHHIPVVGTFHSKYYDDFYQITKSKHLATLGTNVVVDFFNQCDEVWAVSENSAETLKSYGYNREIILMPNGMDISEIDEESKIAAVKQFGIKDNPVLLFVGQQNWKKNILCILEAVSILKKEGKVFQLVLAGQGPHEKEIIRKTQELQIDDRTVFCGHITDNTLLNGLYAAANLFVFPSIYDNAPMVVREAANALCPSVCVRGSSAAEVISDHVNGLLCENNSQDLARILQENMKNKEKLKEMGENAKKSIPIHWNSVCDMALERYQRLIDEKKK